MNIKSAIFQITNSCNLHCRYCYMDADNEHFEFISLENLYEAIKYLALNKIYSIQWTGGEPLLYPDLIKALRFAKENKIESYIFTNGLLINEHNIQELKELVGGFIISLDGDKLNNDFDRGSFDKVINTLRIFKENGIPYTISSTISRYNLNNMESISNIALEYEAKTIRFNAVSFFGRAKSYADEMLDDYEMEYIKSKAKEITQKSNHRLIAETNLFNSKEIRQYGYGLSNVITKSIWINKDLEVSFFPFVANLDNKVKCGLFELSELYIKKVTEDIECVLKNILKENRGILNTYEQIQLHYYEMLNVNF